MTTESAMVAGTVGIVFVVLAAVVKSGLPQLAFAWWQKRRAAPSLPAGGPPSPASPAKAAPALSLPELARQLKQRREQLVAELRDCDEVIAPKQSQ